MSHRKVKALELIAILNTLAYLSFFQFLSGRKSGRPPSSVLFGLCQCQVLSSVIREI
jgi:hypothetical protein